MKRSEMLSKIADFMEQNNEEPLLTKQDAAEAFLKLIEESDMLPPIVQGGSMNGWNRWELEE